MKLAKTLKFSVRLSSERGDLNNEFVKDAMIVSFRMSFFRNRGSRHPCNEGTNDLLSIHLDEKHVIGVSEMIYCTILCFRSFFMYHCQYKSNQFTLRWIFFF
jgi:hypothetical protein